MQPTLSPLPKLQQLPLSPNSYLLTPNSYLLSPKKASPTTASRLRIFRCLPPKKTAGALPSASSSSLRLRTSAHLAQASCLLKLQLQLKPTIPLSPNSYLLKTRSPSRIFRKAPSLGANQPQASSKTSSKYWPAWIDAIAVSTSADQIGRAHV